MSFGINNAAEPEKTLFFNKRTRREVLEFTMNLPFLNQTLQITGGLRPYWAGLGLLWGLLLGVTPAQAQSDRPPAEVNLVLDRYGGKRIRLPQGAEIRFKLKGSPQVYTDYIAEFWEADTAVLLLQARTLVKLRDFDVFYFRRGWVRTTSAGLGFIGGGFSLAALSAPLFPVRYYDPAESAVLGLSALTLSQGVKLFRWKKFRVVPGRSRARILNTSFKPVAER